MNCFSFHVILIHLRWSSLSKFSWIWSFLLWWSWFLFELWQYSFLWFWFFSVFWRSWFSLLWFSSLWRFWLWFFWFWIWFYWFSSFLDLFRRLWFWSTLAVLFGFLISTQGKLFLKIKIKFLLSLISRFWIPMGIENKKIESDSL